jgi:hypothetical protein
MSVYLIVKPVTVDKMVRSFKNLLHAFISGHLSLGFWLDLSFDSWLWFLHDLYLDKLFLLARNIFIEDRVRQLTEGLPNLHREIYMDKQFDF